MSKRPSVIEGLLRPEPSPPSEPAPAPMSPKRRARPDIVHTSIYLPKAVHQQLREIAFHTDTKIHDLIMEGIGAVLATNGKPDIETLKRQSSSA
ncbi:hypothetical protein [Enterovirga rhinocerotis]|uniref:Plasmid segregation centromere-binding protein ParG n=1 Tax=Enterovirga rhinocerotis TaxID=1339210 RepID=A0A4R7CD81_9HYPH|nr:hypothetical protein [Enterovirga rhinocerotis]TDR95469.1 hypothetical protein EV668_0083 [Enterovirga rhinocerotis]